MPGRTFAEELEEACSRLGGSHFQSETDRVHQTGLRDPKDPFHKVDIPKPNPWKQDGPYPVRTDLTI